MNEAVIKAASAGTICEWLSTGFDNNWDSPLQEPYVMLTIDLDQADNLPDEVMNWATRHQSRPTATPIFMLPAGILAKHFLGQPIPERKDED